VAVKQLFETYVYDQNLSSADLLPFVIMATTFSTRSRIRPLAHAAGYMKD
jgi:hypothetical protein